MNKWGKPQYVRDADTIFGGDMNHLLPSWNDIPDEFRHHNGSNKWLQFQSDWFFHGIITTGLIQRDGIDKKIALRHLAAIQCSFEPKHEHKEAGVAYLASLWFTDESTWTIKKHK